MQGTAVGIPTVQAPPVAAPTTANNTAGASSQQTVAPAQTSANDRASVIVVEFLGFGGADESTPSEPNDGSQDDQRRKRPDQQGSYDLRSRFQVIGLGEGTEEQARRLSEEPRKEVGR